MKKAAVEIHPSLPSDNVIRLRAILYLRAFLGSACSHFAGLGSPLSNFAIFSARGGGGPWGLHRREVTPPPGVSNDTQVSGPLASFSYCGDDGKGPASCSCPRRAFGHHDAERCDRHPLPSRTVLPSCTPRTTGVPQGTASWLSATHCRSLCSQQTVPLLDASPCVGRNTSVLKGPVQHNRGACTVPLVS